MKKIGADEAGRGCVLGPLIVCAYCADDSLEPEFKAKGVRDSKLLTASTRASLRNYLMTKGEASVVELSAQEITRAMRSRVSLNELEARTVADALKKLPEAPVIVDSPDPNPSKFARRIGKYYSGDVTAENKADFNHVMAAAASIIAKEVREQRVAELTEELGDFGSGYPSDPRTKQFLEEHSADAAIQKHLRHEWDTLKQYACLVKLSDFQ